MARFGAKSHPLYSIQIILELMQNIVIRVNASKGVFIGFLFPSRRKTASSRSRDASKFFYPRAMHTITGPATVCPPSLVFFTKMLTSDNYGGPCVSRGPLDDHDCLVVVGLGRSLPLGGRVTEHLQQPLRVVAVLLVDHLDHSRNA